MDSSLPFPTLNCPFVVVPMDKHCAYTCQMRRENTSIIETRSSLSDFLGSWRKTPDQNKCAKQIFIIRRRYSTIVYFQHHSRRRWSRLFTESPVLPVRTGCLLNEQPGNPNVIRADFSPRGAGNYHSVTRRPAADKSTRQPLRVRVHVFAYLVS